MSSSSTVSVLLVDDHAKFREGIRTLIEFYNASQKTQLQVVGEAVSVDQALALTLKQHPMLTLLDLELAQGDGIELLTQLRHHHHRGKVLVLSAHQEDEWIFRAMQAGAQGYVLKDQLMAQMSQAITTVLQDEVYLSPRVATSFFRLLHFYTGQSLQQTQAVHFTAREQEVLNWLVQGDSNDVIAQRLYITGATVKAHLTAIFEKLGVTSRTQAIIKALKLGLVTNHA